MNRTLALSFSRSLSVVLASAALAACSSDVCHQALSLEQREEAESAACPGAMITTTDAGSQDAQLAQCETELKSCTASDQQIISQVINCEADLPAFQCKWTTEGLAALSDPSFLQYDAQLTICENFEEDAGPHLTPACDAFSVSTSTSTNNNANWAGTYNVDAASASFDDGESFNAAAPSGTEIIAQSGTTLTWTSFAAPSIPDCDLTLTLDDASATSATIDNLTCGGWTLQSGSAFLEGTTISASASGTDPDGGFFSLNYNMAP